MTERDLADLVDVERYFDEATETTSRQVTARTVASRPPSLDDDRTEAEAFLGQTFHSYRATAYLGSGSCAHVLRGDHVQLPRSVAIKVLKPRYGASRVVVERMKREAEVLLELRHPNVVQCFELGVLPSGLPFLVLELVQGPTLLELVQKKGPLAPARASAIAVQIARGLSALHERGVVHRDLKLSNLMLEEERVKITDLGIILLEATDATRLTTTARPLGSRSYMAPEQLRDPRSVTRAADLYALGVILTALVSGRLPGADSAAPTAPLGAAIARLLDPDPAKRLTAPALLQLLEPSPMPPRRRWPRLLALVAAPLGLTVGLWAHRASQPPAVAPPPPPALEAPVEAPIAIGRSVPAEDRARAGDPPGIEAHRRTRARSMRTSVPPALPPAVEAPPPPLPLSPPPPRIDRDEIEGRLARSVERLRAVASALPKGELKALESSYFSLRRALAGAETDADLARVARAVHDYDRDVRRLLERFGTVEP